MGECGEAVTLGIHQVSSVSPWQSSVSWTCLFNKIHWPILFLWYLATLRFHLAIHAIHILDPKFLIIVSISSIYFHYYLYSSFLFPTSSIVILFYRGESALGEICFFARMQHVRITSLYFIHLIFTFTNLLIILYLSSPTCQVHLRFNKKRIKKKKSLSIICRDSLVFSNRRNFCNFLPFWGCSNIFPSFPSVD